MNKGVIALAGLGLGAGLMYFADPQKGKGRRARLRDTAVHGSHTLKDAAGAASRDTEHRLAGIAARARAAVAHRPAPNDDVLAARVRSRLGRLVSHPGAIEVKAASGRVALTGPVFEAELNQLLHGVRAVDGVIEIENLLESHADAADIPALQGAGPLEFRALPPAWIRWTPATRVLAGAAGLALALALVVAGRRTIQNTAGEPAEPHPARGAA
jgi:hypothetical protein